MKIHSTKTTCSKHCTLAITTKLEKSHLLDFTTFLLLTLSRSFLVKFVSIYFLVPFQSAPLYSSRGCLFPHSLWKCQRQPIPGIQPLECSHSFLIFVFSKQIQSIPPFRGIFSVSASLTKSIHQNNPGPSTEHFWLSHLPLIWIHVLLCPCREINTSTFPSFLRLAIITLLLPPRQSKSHYLPPWLINSPHTLLNPTLVSPDPFQTSYNFQGFLFSSETGLMISIIDISCCSHVAFSPRKASPTTGFV